MKKKWFKKKIFSKSVYLTSKYCKLCGTEMYYPYNESFYSRYYDENTGERIWREECVRTKDFMYCPNLCMYKWKVENNKQENKEEWEEKFVNEPNNTLAIMHILA